MTTSSNPNHHHNNNNIGTKNNRVLPSLTVQLFQPEESSSQQLQPPLSSSRRVPSSQGLFPSSTSSSQRSSSSSLSPSLNNNNTSTTTSTTVPSRARRSSFSAPIPANGIINLNQPPPPLFVPIRSSINAPSHPHFLKTTPSDRSIHSAAVLSSYREGGGGVGGGTKDVINDKESISSSEESTMLEYGGYMILNCLWRMFSSIKFFLILLLCGSVVISVLVLSAVWLGSLLPSIYGFSTSVKALESDKLASYIQQTIGNVVRISAAAKSQLTATLDYSNKTWVEKQMYAIFKSEMQFQAGLTTTTFIGDDIGTCYGIFSWNGMPALIDANLVDQKLYYCKDFETHDDYCHRNSTPDAILSPFDLSIIVEIGNKFAGRPAFTPSYTDKTLPQYAFLSLINSWKLPTPVNGNNFKYYFGYDLSVGSISNYLKKFSESDELGSRSMVVEADSNYIVAFDRDVPFVTWDATGNSKRLDLSSLEDPVMTGVVQNIKNKYPVLKEIRCNQKVSFSGSKGMFISIQRLCTDYNIDWFIVYAVPNWSFISSAAIGVCSAMAASIIIVIISTSIGIFLSHKVVSPFYDLIYLFDTVSDMDLDKIEINFSRFAEVRHLQHTFLFMVHRMKQYRCFIPPHLIAQIEGSGEEQELQQMDSATEGSVTKGSNTSTNSIHDVVPQKPSKPVLNRTMTMTDRKKKFSSTRNLFALHLEHKMITMVSIFMEGLNELIQEAPARDVLQLLSDVFDQLNAIIKTRGGSLIGTENDVINLAYNAVTNLPRHEKVAVSTAQVTIEKLTKFKALKWKNLDCWRRYSHLMDALKFRVAVCSQLSHCGNIGNSEMKHFTIMSSLKHNNELMLETAKRLDLEIVMSERVSIQIDQFMMRYVDTQEMIDDSAYTSPLFMDEQTHASSKVSTKIYELGESTAVKEDEWMYELADQEKKGRWALYNKACDYYFQGEYGEAISHFEAFLHKHSSSGTTAADKPAQYLLGRCRSLLDQHSLSSGL
ncbi:hypothetical protein C9374_009761 [Naegleria lovaniensis]|uniref:Guanylate cyclase domain-containing protein n=1 Tax=Naegleria lovaniensis TaxID=51637 RepID=A0AA88H3W2_NAELO|nr:uncharacterized protein C9374_009761 [Naegleria lovaniensis]KAG2393184.1 hypothetical protein C9374_009761 [Naegleria lovaniensis]